MSDQPIALPGDGIYYNGSTHIISEVHCPRMGKQWRYFNQFSREFEPCGRIHRASIQPKFEFGDEVATENGREFVVEQIRIENGKFSYSSFNSSFWVGEIDLKWAELKWVTRIELEKRNEMTNTPPHKVFSPFQMQKEVADKVEHMWGSDLVEMTVTFEAKYVRKPGDNSPAANMYAVTFKGGPASMADETAELRAYKEKTEISLAQLAAAASSIAKTETKK